MSLDDPARWLGRTAYLDLDSPTVRRLAAQLSAGRPLARDRAVAAHRHVSRQVRFGFRPAFYQMRASEVLRGGVGFCNTQSTAFIALLRAMGVPARTHFVDINTEVLHGVLSPGTPYVDHCWTEVWLDGRWRSTDAYIVDPPLQKSATARLRAERRTLGYGAHVQGTCEWDGRSDAFSQFVRTPGGRLSTRDHGVFDDVGAFYAAPGPRWNRLNPVISLALLASAGGIDRRLNAMRASA